MKLRKYHGNKAGDNVPNILNNVLINKNKSKSRNVVVIDGNESIGKNSRSFSQNYTKVNFQQNIHSSATKSKILF